ncbi:5882_t:CDS:2 [Cetraspora pellucida]|uniref:5882_t:CDS:1 n=1 Tax=Cetraspora pellucida TaxID=1433469 RepID=A0A9N9IXE4_9GLOM|nr:5882_t:CDS:2 [Cetraspora pellucida]
MESAIHGDLHNYLLKNLNKLSWKEKLDILRLIVRNLKELHEKITFTVTFAAVFKNGHYTKKSDIYSLGMIFWKIGADIKPFYDIMDGLSPNFIDGIPKEIVDLMKKCWDNDPLERPTAHDIVNELNIIIQKLDEKQISFPSHINMINQQSTHTSYLPSSFISKFLKT